MGRRAASARAGKSNATSPADYSIRIATLRDLPILMRHRRLMFLDAGLGEGKSLDEMHATSEPFFAKCLSNGTFHAWLVEDNRGRVVAGGGLFIYEYHSSPSDPIPKRPFIVNMYTEPEWRRKGIARRLMEIMIDWCRANGFGSVLLHASEQGQALYESMGFKPTKEMELLLR